MNKLEKFALLYAVAGVATLLHQIDKVSKGQGIWAGLGATNNTGGPGATTAAIETIAFWPVALMHNPSPVQGK
jgi:hypothetical protein